MSHIVVAWLEKIGVTVTYHDLEVENQFCPEEKKISVRNDEDEDKLLFALLHEAGHAILSHDRNFHKSRYPSKHHEDPHIDMWLHDLIKEEYDAWEEGFQLAQRLSIDIDIDKYETLAEECLNSYRGFATKINDFSNKAFDRNDKQFDTIFEHFVKISGD